MSKKSQNPILVRNIIFGMTDPDFSFLQHAETEGERKQAADLADVKNERQELIEQDQASEPVDPAALQHIGEILLGLVAAREAAIQAEKPARP